MGLPYNKNRIILPSTVFELSAHVMDRQTMESYIASYYIESMDRRTNGRAGDSIQRAKHMLPYMLPRAKMIQVY